jgi:Methylamine utilisation protein MauE
VSVLAGPFTIAAALLVIGGGLKAARPGDTAHALSAVGLSFPGFVTPRVLVRLGGAAEVVVGAGALATGSPAFAALVAVSYLVFAAFVVVALRSGRPISSCGCFGKVDTPPSLVHVVIDLAAAGVALAAVFVGEVSLPDTVATQPLAGVPFLFLCAIGLYLVFLSFTALPKTMAAVREVSA